MHADMIHGQRISTTRTLSSALPYLVASSTTGFLWIDQLCINQFDILEKNTQVPMMGEIYAGATRTIAWFGEGSPELLDKVRLLPQIAQDAQRWCREQDDNEDQPETGHGPVGSLAGSPSLLSLIQSLSKYNQELCLYYGGILGLQNFPTLFRLHNGLTRSAATLVGMTDGDILASAQAYNDGLGMSLRYFLDHDYVSIHRPNS